MKSSSVILSLCALVTLSGTAFADDAFNVPSSPSSLSSEGAAAPVSATKGSMLISANGSSLAQVYRVGADGAVQIIIDGKMVTVPRAGIVRSIGLGQKCNANASCTGTYSPKDLTTQANATFPNEGAGLSGAGWYQPNLEVRYLDLYRPIVRSSGHT